jgi:hypothetical protein
MIANESDADRKQDAPAKIRMTEAMRKGLDELEREYSAFVESSFQTLALITDRRVRSAEPVRPRAECDIDR